MKSGIFESCNPLGDPLMWDHELYHECTSNLKDDYTNSLLDCMNYSDSQLEDFILNSELCGDLENLTFRENVTFLNNDGYALSPVVPKEDAFNGVESLSTATLLPVDDVAHYEEVYACNSASPSIDSGSNYSEWDTSDNESIKSVVSNKRRAKTVTTKNVTRKSKQSRSKRNNFDQRVKNQNKIAAKKYRIKKREEMYLIEETLSQEKNRNKQLKSTIEETKVQIKVLKELLGKYLTSKQIRKYSSLHI